MITPRYRHSIFTNKKQCKDFDKKFTFGETITLATVNAAPDDEEPIYLDFGSIDDVVILPGKRLVADILYNGPIECIDKEDLPLEQQDYPCVNPLFHSQNLEELTKGHYRFTTSVIPDEKTSLPTLALAQKNVPKNMRKEVQRHPFFPPFTALKHFPLDLALSVSFDFVQKRSNGKERNDSYYDIAELITEAKTTGSFSGDCKSVATMMCGAINALGLPARALNGTSHSRSDFLESQCFNSQTYQAGHMWAEAYVPRGKNTGVWVPVDPNMDILKVYPTKKEVMSYNFISLPKFLEPKEKTAKLTLRYE